MRFENTVALITGAAVGIGRAAALRMAEEGAKLVLLDLNPETLESVKAECEALKAEVEVYLCDISDEPRVIEVVKAAMERFGKIDILVNNAAIWRSKTSFLETPSEIWRKYFEVNVLGTANVTRAVLPGMIEREYGRIVNVASVVGVYAKGNMAQYSATKAAVISFTASLAREVADKGITVNCVSPGTVSPSENPDITFTRPEKMCYIGRSGSDLENANLICFLASDETPYLSGQNIVLDGVRKFI